MIYRIGLLLNLSTSYGRQVLEGIHRHPARSGWELLNEGWGDFGLEDEPMDGYIAELTESRQAEQLRGRPLVDISGSLSSGWVSVTPDYAQAGQLAAEHLLERGLSRFAFLGLRNSLTSAQLEASFCEPLTSPASVHHCALNWRGRRQNQRSRLLQWLVRLPAGTGLFAADDLAARRVLQICRRLGRRVPDQLAVLGMGDYDLVNRITRPSLSTVAVPAREVGYRAAELLAAILAGQRPSSERIPCQGVLARGSTDLAGCPDELVKAALSYLERHYREPLTVSELAVQLSVSKRLLEQRFAAALGFGPGEAVRRLRISRAQQLLRETDWTLKTVARAVGLQSAEHLCALFRQRLGMTPGRFREPGILRSMPKTPP